MTWNSYKYDLQAPSTQHTRDKNTENTDFVPSNIYHNMTEDNIILYIYIYIQGVPGGKVNILGGHSISHSKQKPLYEHVSYSERFPR